MTRTRTLVIGLGAIAFAHLERLAARDDVEVGGVCDLDATLARAVGERFGVTRFGTDAEAMLDALAPDAVHVLTPPAAHAPLAIAALRHGAHVLVEKPAATTPGELRAMHDAAERAGRLLVENHNYLFTPALAAAREDPTLGDLVGVDVAFTGVMGGDYADPCAPHFAHALPGGALRNFVSHPVSIAVGLLGAPREVHAVRRRRDPGFPSDDELRVLLGTDDAWATLTVSRHARPPRFTVALEGTRGRADVDLYTNTWTSATRTAAVTGAAAEGVAELRRAAVLAGRALGGRKDPFAGLGALLDRFYAAVRTGAAPPVTPALMTDIAATVDVALAAGRPEVAACA